MKVRYQIVTDITADGMLGPLRVVELFQHALDNHLTMALELGKVRVAAVYTLAPDEHDDHPHHTVERVPGTDQSRAVEEIRDPRVT